jgi:tetratricopeptide (TPR) repeat protein
MTTETEAATDPSKEVDECLADLAGTTAPPEQVIDRLRRLADRVAADSPLRPRFLRARAVALNRLGYYGEALGDLQEARVLLADASELHEVGEIDRAIALIHSWRGDAREASLSLLRALGSAVVTADHGAAGLALLDAGRVEMEIGRAAQAEFFFSLGLRIGGDALPVRERARSTVSLLQSLVAARDLHKVDACLRELEPLLAGGSARVRFLAELERARIAIASRAHAAADAALARAEEIMRPDPESFEAVELAHVRAEGALAAGEREAAEKLLVDVIARYAADELAGREVVARLLHAEALFGLERREEAERTLVAALRRAVARGLNGYADAVRSRMAASGTSENAWHAGEPLAQSARAETAQRFVRRRRLGTGAFGSVSRAYDLEQGIEVALKQVSLAGLYDPATRARLLESLRTEVAAVSRIDHPGVARVYGMLVEGEGDALLIEEFVDGPTLRSVMAGALEPSHALELAVRISYALASVHAAGVIHRDLKPENIVLRAAASPVIVDFGIALVAGAASAAKAAGIGTVGYMPPEQTRGHADARADLYALGVIIHELLRGERPPAPEGGLRALLPETWQRRRRAARLVAAGVDPDTAALLARLLAPHRWARPASAAEVADALSKVLTHLASDAGEQRNIAAAGRGLLQDAETRTAPGANRC